MRRDFRRADFDALAALWNATSPDRYRISADLLRQNSVGHPTFDWGASSQLDMDGAEPAYAIVKKAPWSLYNGPDRDTYHLSALCFHDPLVALELMRDVKTVLRARGANRLIFGQDSGHFWPGGPTDHRALVDFLMVEGFVDGGEVVDLERDLTSYENPFRPPEGEVRPLEMGEENLLELFLSREFPGRWRYDVTQKVRSEGISQSVVGWMVGGAMEGFAMIQQEGTKMPIGGAVWNLDLGLGWGALGPIGVAKSRRGEGGGHALLGGALSVLRDRGTRRAIIDWTTLNDFYGRHGFEPTRAYRSLSLRLGE